MRRGASFLAAVAAAACSSAWGNGTSPGELGTGKLSYVRGPGADAQ